MNKSIFFCVTALILLASGIPSFAKVDITPSVALREDYNDNIFLTKTDKEHDYITTASPSIMLKYSPSSLLDVSLDYGFNFRFYSRNNELNDTSLKKTQHANFVAQARPLNHVFIDVSDIYGRVPIDIRRPFATGNEFRNLTDSNIFTISPYVTVPLSSTVTTTLGYKYNNTWYRSDLNSDSESHTAFLTLNKKFTSKLNGEIRYNYYKYNPDPEAGSGVIRDYDSHRGSLAVAYQITPNFAVNGEVGKAKYNYKSGRDFDTDFWNINTDYNLRITESTSLTAGYGTSLKDSSISGAYKSRRFDIFFKTGKAFKLSVNPYYSIDKYFETDREDRITGITANIIKPLTGKMDILLDGLWEKQKFLPKDEKVNKYSAGLSLDYKISQKITASLAYRNNNRNSNIDTREFANNIVSLLGKVVF
jgi:hypothetical protein